MTESTEAPAGPSTSSAVVWTLAARQGERLLGIVSIAILARLISPSNFGLVAMAASVAALVETCSAFGFDWALVRLPIATPAHYDSAWTLRVICGLCVSAVLMLAAYPAALYFSQPAVAAIIVVMGLNNLIASVENIWMAEYRRQGRFQQEFKLRIGAKIAGFLTATVLAFLTHSFWALVAGITASRAMASALSFQLHRGRPRWDLSRQADLLRFSVWLLVGNITDVLRDRFAELWIGRHLGARDVGLYSMASELAALATTEIAAPINRAVFAKYTQQQGSIAGLRDGYLQVSGLIWAVGVPAAAGIGICAPDIVALLLGSQWARAAAALRILACAGVLEVMAANTQYVYWALNRSRFVTILSIIGALAFIVLTLLLGAQFGVLGVACAQVAAAALVLAVNLAVLARTLQMGFAVVWFRNYRIVVASAVMGAAVLALQHACGAWPSAWMRLAVLVTAGVLCYVAVLLGAWQLLGRPAGPERDMCRVMESAGTHFINRSKTWFVRTTWS